MGGQVAQRVYGARVPRFDQTGPTTAFVGCRARWIACVGCRARWMNTLVHGRRMTRGCKRRVGGGDVCRRREPPAVGDPPGECAHQSWPQSHPPDRTHLAAERGGGPRQRQPPPPPPPPRRPGLPRVRWRNCSPPLHGRAPRAQVSAQRCTLAEVLATSPSTLTPSVDKAHSIFLTQAAKTMMCGARRMRLSQHGEAAHQSRPDMMCRGRAAAPPLRDPGGTLPHTFKRKRASGPNLGETPHSARPLPA